MSTIDKAELKGFFYAGIAAVALANSFIFSKLSFQEVDFFQFGFWWFVFGTTWNLIYLVISQKGALSKKNLIKTIDKPLIAIAVLEAVASGLFYYAILIMENPGVVSFIGNIGPVFVTVLGYLLLKESFNKIQLAGIVLAIGGISTLNYKGYSSLSEIFIPGSQYVILASFLFAVAAIIARKNSQKLDAGVLSLVRAIILLLAFSALISVFSDIKIASFKSMGYLAIGSFLEVFITIIFAYMSFKYIKAFKTSITISTKGIFALLSAWAFLHLQPAFYEIVGGVLSILGVILVSKETTNKTKVIV